MRSDPCLLIAGLACVGMTACPVPAQTTWYVDDDAALGGDGASWSTAFRFLQDALAVAQAGDEVRVAAGVYCPDESADYPAGTKDRTAAFHLATGVALRGGFAGVGLLRPEQRNTDANLTILSGDLEGNDGLRSGGGAGAVDNSHHVVIAAGVDRTALLEGFTISGGFASGEDSPHLNGGGLTASGASPTVRNCRFTNNYSQDLGGAVDLFLASNALFEGCTFDQNAPGAVYSILSSPVFRDCDFEANEDGAVIGRQNPNCRLVGCSFRGNVSVSGGALLNVAGMTTAVNCAFQDNVAAGLSESYGGAVLNLNGQVRLINCLLRGNSGVRGGAVANRSGYVTLNQCTLLENTAELSGGDLLWYVDVGPASGWVVNSILWGGSAPSGPELALHAAAGAGSWLMVQHSTVQGGADAAYVGPESVLDWGAGAIDADPLANTSGALAAGSPCIDTGLNSAVPLDLLDADQDGDTQELLPIDWAGLARIWDGLGDGVVVVDMGAREFGARRPLQRAALRTGVQP